MRGQSLKDWFYLNARLPLFFSVLVFFLFEILLLVIIGKNQLEHQRGVALRLAELSKIAMLQKSSSLLQAGVDLAVRDLRAHRAFLCESSRIYATPNLVMSLCPVEEITGYRVLEVPITFEKPALNRTYQFVLQVPVFPKENVLTLILGISIVMSFLGVWLLGRVRIRLEKDLFEPLFRNLSKNIVLPIRELEELRGNLLQLNQLRTQEAVSRAVIERGAQVAHDIQSPLTALLFASNDFEVLPSSSKNVIRSAVKRIAAIVESLESKKQGRESTVQMPLKDILYELFDEKKTEYQSAKNILWAIEVGDLPAEAMSPLADEELKRILSNLINNSVEAMEGLTGSLSLGASMTKEQLIIWVRDEGKGIAPHWIQHLGERGFSLDKEKGRGLGLSHAKETVERLGGKLSFKEGKKTGLETQISFSCVSVGNG